MTPAQLGLPLDVQSVSGKHATGRASTAALHDLLGVRVSGVFACMEAAEEEIAAANLSPEIARRAFGALCPTPPLRGKSLDLYRSHAREILERLRSGSPVEPGTVAECLAACLDASLLAPFRQDGQAFAEWLYAQVFPEHAAEIGAGETRERWEHQVQEDLAALRKRLACSRGES